MSTNIYQFEADSIKGESVSLEKYKGKVLLIVNTASKCGFTPQYRELQKLYESYKDKGLEILGFPCDQFAHQEPGNNEQIQEFCSINFGVTFPLFSKVDVNGQNAHPLFDYLRKKNPGIIGNSIKWNFTKFLVDKNGIPVKRYSPATDPARLAGDIEKLLNSRSENLSA